MPESLNTEVCVLIGAGAIGQAIARRVAIGKTLLVADINESTALQVAETLGSFGFTTESATVDVASEEYVGALATRAAELGTVTDVIHTAGLSPSQASAEAIIAVDLVGTAFVLDAFGRVIGRRGSGLVISSQAGYMLPPLPAEQNQALGSTPAAELSALPFLNPANLDSGAAYALAKRANSLSTLR